MAYVNIVTSDRGWILENLATQISSRLPYVKFAGSVDAHADIQYYITYSCRRRRISPIEVAYFAHLEPEREARDKFFGVAQEVERSICHARLYADLLSAQGTPNVSTISPGVDLVRFSPKLRIGVVGRTYHTGRKGEHLVAQVMDIPEIEWVFTGEGWPEPALKLSDAALPDFYRQLDYVLVPALYEGGPMCAVEALAAGTEVIAPPVGWVPEFPHIEYRAGDCADLRRVLVDLVEKKRALRASVLDRTWEAWAEGHDRVFRQLADERSLKLAAPQSGVGARAPRRIGLFLHGGEGNSPGGPTVRVPRLARELLDRGDEAQLVRHPGAKPEDFDIVHAFNAWAPKSALDLIRRAKRAGSRVVFSPIFLDLSLRALWQDELPDLFEAAKTEDDLAAALEQFGRRYARARGRSGAPAEPAPGYHAAVREMAALSDHVIYLSDRERLRLEAIGASAASASIVHNPVDFKLFAGADPSLFESAFGLKDFVLCVARQESRKNQLMLMRALKDTKAPLVLVGHAASPAYVKLMDRYKTANVHIIARLPPNSPLLASAFAAARVVALPSWAEGAPLAGLEAAAAGGAMVLSDESGESEYFGSFASYADPASIDSLRNAIMARYESTRTRGEINAQRDFIAANYNWDRHRDATREIYRQVHSRVRPVPAARAVANAAEPLPIVFDVTTSANHKGRWTGIARVEAALAIALKQSPRVASIRFVAWNNTAQAFVEIPFDAIRAGKTSTLLGFYDTAPIRPLHLPPNAHYIVGGSGWMQNSVYAEALVAFKRQHGLRLTPIIHDVIPIRFPFWFNEGYAPVFASNLTAILGNADHIMAVSEHTRADINDFAANVLDIFIPQIGTFREGDEIAQIAEQRTGTLPDSVAELKGKSFVLCVGAIHQRKNHKLLYDVWVKLTERMGSQCPTLVIVGGVAWNGQDVARALKEDRRVKDKVVILDGVDDEILEALYKSCLFTVYPSLYEGWGLPVSESLRYGKLCIASNASSLPEIAPELTELVDPLDPSRWLAKIQFYAGSQRARETFEARIAARHRPFSWDESAAALLGSLALVGAGETSRPYTLGAILNFADRLDGARTKISGWHPTEKWGCWSSQLVAKIGVSLPSPARGDVVLIAEVKCLPQNEFFEVNVRANGQSVARWTIGDKDSSVRHAVISRDLLGNSEHVIVEFCNPNLTPISAVAKTKDRRLVGLGVCRLAIADVETVADAETYFGRRGADRYKVVLGRAYDFLKGPDERSCLLGDWQFHSAWGAINADMRPRIALVVSQRPGEDLDVEIFVRPVATKFDPLTVIAIVNDVQADSFTLRDDRVQKITLRIPRKIREAAEPIVIDLVPSDLRSPQGAGLGTQALAFGFGLISMRVSAAEARGQAYDEIAGEISYRIGDELIFSNKQPVAASQCVSLAGPWHRVEAGGVWSFGELGVLTLRLKGESACDLAAAVELYPFADLMGADNLVTISVNSQRLFEKRLGALKASRVGFAIPASLIGPDGLATFEFRSAAALSPYRLGRGVDERPMGVRISKLRLEEAPLLIEGKVKLLNPSLRPAELARFFGPGWYDAERSGRWSRAEHGQLNLATPTPGADYRLFLFGRVVDATPETPATVRLIRNTIPVGEWRIPSEKLTLLEAVDFANYAAEGQVVSLGFEREGAKSPKQLGLSSDGRKLGLFLSGAILLERRKGERAEQRAVELLAAAGLKCEPLVQAVRPQRVDISSGAAICVLDMSSRGKPKSALKNGWHEPELEGAWSKLPDATLVIPADAAPGYGDLSAVLKMRVYGAGMAGPVDLLFALRSRGVAIKFASDAWEDVSLTIEPADVSPDGSIAIMIRRPTLLTPNEVETASHDTRKLGVMLQSITLRGARGGEADRPAEVSVSPAREPALTR